MPNKKKSKVYDRFRALVLAGRHPSIHSIRLQLEKEKFEGIPVRQTLYAWKAEIDAQAGKDSAGDTAGFTTALAERTKNFIKAIDEGMANLYKEVQTSTGEKFETFDPATLNAVSKAMDSALKLISKLDPQGLYGPNPLADPARAKYFLRELAILIRVEVPAERREYVESEIVGLWERSASLSGNALDGGRVYRESIPYQIESGADSPADIQQIAGTSVSGSSQDGDTSGVTRHSEASPGVGNQPDNGDNQREVEA